MATQKFRVDNASGMWVRTEPVVSEATKKVLLPNGQLVEKLAESEKPNWWRVSTTFNGEVVEGFSHSSLLVPDGVPVNGGEPVTMETLLERTLNAISHLSPQARSNYLQAIREGGPMFEQHAGRTARLRCCRISRTGELHRDEEPRTVAIPGRRRGTCPRLSQP